MANLVSTLFLCSWIALAVDLVLFTALYFCVILLRVNDAGGKVGATRFSMCVSNDTLGCIWSC